MSGKRLRTSLFIDPRDQRSLLLELDHPLMTGGLERISHEEAVERAVSIGVDGLILSRGSLKRFMKGFLGRNAPALLLRADWTNIWRGDSHPLPMREPAYTILTGAEDAIKLNAAALVSYLFMGHETDYEDAMNIEVLSALASQCDDWEIPLIVEAAPIGDRVTSENYVEVAGLAMRIAVEIGADCVAIAYPGTGDALSKLISSCQVPLLILDDFQVKLSAWQPSYDLLEVAYEALRLGARGFIIGMKTLMRDDYEERLKELKQVVHGGG